MPLLIQSLLSKRPSSQLVFNWLPSSSKILQSNKYFNISSPLSTRSGQKKCFHTSINSSFYWQTPSDIKDGKVSRVAPGNLESSNPLKEGKNSKKKTVQQQGHHALFLEANLIAHKKKQYKEWNLKEIPHSKEDESLWVLESLDKHIHCLLLSPNAKSMIGHYEKIEELFQNNKENAQTLQYLLENFAKKSFLVSQSIVGYIGRGLTLFYMNEYEKAKTVFLTLNLIDNQMGVEKGGVGETDYPALYMSFVYLCRVYSKLDQQDQLKSCQKAIKDIEGLDNPILSQFIHSHSN